MTYKDETYLVSTAGKLMKNKKNIKDSDDVYYKTDSKGRIVDSADAVNCVLDLLTSDKELAVEIYDYTKTASMLKDVTPTFENPSQEDIDKYAADDMIVDVTLGNNQLVWGGFQEENAKDIAAWLQGDETFEDVLAASDARVDASSATK